MAVRCSSRLSQGDQKPFGHNREYFIPTVFRKHFRWTSDLYMKMATYLSEHYPEYSAAIILGQRIQFLRIMKTKLDVLKDLDDPQITTGFRTLLKKYELAKAKMNSGGGQPEQCPYFYILDATFAKTPKRGQSCIKYETETGDFGNEVVIENDEESSSEDSIKNGKRPEIPDPVCLKMVPGRRPRHRLGYFLPVPRTVGQKNEKIKGRPYMWTSDDHMKVAKYLSEHYDEYSAALKQGNRIQFLRIMRTKLDGLEGLTDIQIKGGFKRFIKKYELAKVNSGGKQKGKTHKQRIIKQCPYFYILDETFARTPKDIIYEPETGDTGNEVEIENDEESSSEVSIVFDDNVAQHEIPEIDIDIEEEDNEYSECHLASPVSPPNYLDCNLMTCSPSVASYVKKENNEYSECRLIRPVSPPDYFDCDLITRSPSVASYVKEACKNIEVDKVKMKSSIDTLMELVDSKVHDQIEVEKQKLKLEERKFAAQHALQLKKLDIERLKVKAESERKAQRFAMKKAKTKQIREIKQLRLQIRLEKLKNSPRDTAEDN